MRRKLQLITRNNCVISQITTYREYDFPTITWMGQVLATEKRYIEERSEHLNIEMTMRDLRHNVREKLKKIFLKHRSKV